jgi:hypothetical protein
MSGRIFPDGPTKGVDDILGAGLVGIAHAEVDDVDSLLGSFLFYCIQLDEKIRREVR